MFRVFAAFTAIALLAQICVASAGDYGTRDEAVAMVKRVEDMFAKAGPDSTFKAVSDKSLATFHDRDLLPFHLRLEWPVCRARGAASADPQKPARPEGSGWQVPDPRNDPYRQRNRFRVGQLQVAKPDQQ